MLDQIREVTWMNLCNVPSRLGSSAVIIVGIAGVVAVLTGLLSMATGFSSALENTSDPNRALILRDGGTGEMQSGMGIDDYNIVSQLEGLGAVSGELYVVADIPKKGTNTSANVVIRGVEQSAFEVRPEVEIVAGRMFEPGRGELIAGSKAMAMFVGLEVGNRINFRDSEWTVVGMFKSGGSAYESEVWTDLPIAQAAFRRGGSLTSMRVLLDDPGLAEALDEQIKADPRLDLTLQTESGFYKAQSQERAALINTFGYSVAFIMAIGAVFAALNTMYTAVSTRTVEIATLRALGFGSMPIVVSVMIESLTLALMGGVIGGALTYVAFDGYTASTLNNASFSQVVFDFAVTPALMQVGISWALVLGMIGGLFPAVRAARLPITRALMGDE
ncbi:MAG: ABC transporter permease [Pseudomonadales bacterium]|jgi:putative ABC transport system permease protein|nr:ABC transporter permease [Pseudomonadales bacterium]MDP6472005.1 ABC transporter permease [Pseudomonadales bacterium]MDP6826722.1 ABC transporter permease [Pseudomonadales bacterium]MDP6972656.1 ABC transporter permease [Pseudomonadales bacterium]|tara:strand:+ start:941 stop:2107 length:1167 start_codon:yes stop_codon:yes gene_type:complete